MIEKGKRKKSCKLYNFLLKNKNSENKDFRQRLFRSTFEEDYRESKDYLLRNELRLLNKIIGQFLVEQTIPVRDSRYYFLSALLERGQLDLFEIEVKKELGKAKRENDPEGIGRLSQLVLQKNLRNMPLKATTLRNNLTLCRSIQESQRKACLYAAAEIKVKVNFLLGNLVNLGLEEELHVQATGLQIASTDEYLQFVNAAAGSYIARGTEKKELLLKALDLLKRINSYKIDKEKEQIPLLNNLAIEFLLAREYTEAVEAFESLLSIKSISAVVRSSISFNYLTCLMKAESYDKALHLIESGLLPDGAIPVLQGKLSSLKAMAYVFTGQPQKAFAVLPQNLKGGSRHDYFYSRLVLCITYFEDKMKELATREVENLLQTMGKSEEFRIHRFCAHSLKTLFAGFKSPEKRKKLFREVDDYIIHGGSHTDLLPLLWLRSFLATDV